MCTKFPKVAYHTVTVSDDCELLRKLHQVHFEGLLTGLANSTPYGLCTKLLVGLQCTTNGEILLPMNTEGLLLEFAWLASITLNPSNSQHSEAA